MAELRIGNVIRAPEGGGIWIVSDVHGYGEKPTVEAISFDSENCSAVQRLDDHVREDTCLCGDNEIQQGDPDPDCDTCHGDGRNIRRIKGWKHSKVLASNVEEFIMKGIKSTMGLGRG